ncbi:hypothetical protein OIDMADRAFT_99899 [Oidiodendron maius Zn]|uniref:Cytochrome P450 n=1 Tax=Oidiodendron maius (strain Zn) TaxID=913774 RepID=A0A0C3I0G8_OIDMZ|nr:hypothetical protein OIDMADRAFT_99899 [Oidiodendron maius Zn]
MFNLANHPLADFPGPRSAAFTEWYKTYRELYCGESWVRVLDELHKKYGKIVRVGPNELSFSDPAAYHEIYNGSNRWDKEPTLYQCFGQDYSTFGCLKYADAKTRRDILGPMFSRKAISDYQGLIQTNVDRLCEAVTHNNAAGKSSDLFYGFRCFAVDTIMSFCFAKSVDALGEADFKAPIVEAMYDASDCLLLFKHFPLLQSTIFRLPRSLTVMIVPQTSGITRVMKVLSRQVTQLIADNSGVREFPHPVVFQKLLDRGANAKGKALNERRMLHEAQSLLFGASDTVSNQMMLGVWHLLENPDYVRKLKEELYAAWPVLEDSPSFEELEKLPFLTAVVKESLRIGPGGIPGVLSRITPTKGLTISGSVIPKDTIVGMSVYTIHNSELIFKDPKTFDPDRWLEADSESLEKWLVPFSKGPRSCLGINLAYCELYLTIAALFRRFDLEVDSTCGMVNDLEWRDTFVARFSGHHLKVFCRPAAR